jgi:hypothetical protein
MTTTGRYDSSEATREERLDYKMEQEIENQKEHLLRYASNTKNALGNQRAKEILKSMVNCLVEQL